ncbi:unnamed protein product [Cyclocybe aegerita]|uniref:Uncharacterized protein n=1 Tax=Cyclocybe aegerita TaxID=1973307 RepID=A0A8S0WLK6_CYCAE|nr:unnamed protein product [Cyclocybe aegerita]
MGQVTTEIYFYTTPEFAQTVRDSRGAGLPLTVDTSYSSPFDVPALQGREEMYAKMHEVDREKEIHSPGLYAVWNAKPFLLENAIKMRKLRERKEYDYVFWRARAADMGGGYSGDRDEPGGTKGAGPVDSDISEGSFFGGTPKAVTWFSRTFYSYHDYYLSLGFFAGKDQTLYNAVIFLFPSRFITVWHGDPDSPARGGMPPNGFTRGRLGACGPEWYYYQWWLSDKHSREEMRKYWMEHDREPEKARWWKMRRIPCRMALLRSMEDVLKSSFGNDWTPPARTIGLRPKHMW